PSSSCENLKQDSSAYIQGTIVAPDDPVFAGISEETIDWWCGNYSAFGVDAEDDDVGNGTLLAKTPDNRMLYARWEAGVEFYPGSGQIPQGERVYIGNGSDDGGVIAYFNFSQTAEKIFWNEMSRLTGYGYVPKKEIVFVKTNANNNDSIVIANIENYDGGMAYNVTVIEQGVITEDLLPQFNAADLVIMGRSIASGDVATGKDVWDQITSPVLTMNMWGMRSSRALWTPSASCENLKQDSAVYFQGTIVAPDDPVFAGITEETFDWWCGNYSAFGVDAEGDDFGNGTLLAQTPDGRMLFARWEAGVEFYPGSGQVPQGERSYIGNGSDDGGVIAYFNWSGTSEMIFWREMARMTGYVPRKTIVFVKTNANNNDSIVIANIANHENGTAYNVTVIEQPVITEDLLPQFNAADLVIMGRSIGSADVATGKDVWDQITAPVLTMNMWGMRSSRALWTPSASCENLKQEDGVFFQGTIVAPDDPVFTGITEETFDWWSGNYSAFGPDAEGDDVGNGTLLAQTPDGRMLFARWEAGVEFYPGSGQTPMGERSYIGNGSDDGGVIAYFNWSETSEMIFWNEVDRMTGRTTVDAKEIILVYDSSRVDVVTGINPDLSMKAILEAEGYIVNPMPLALISEATQEQIDILNNADVIYIGRAINSGNFSSPNKEIWHEITTPIITTSLWALRNSRMNWFNSGSAANTDTEDDAVFQAIIEQPDDPVFEGIESPCDWWIGSYSTIAATNAGNGTVMARKADDSTVVYARWEAGTPFYAETTDTPAGERVFIGNSSDNKKDIDGNNMYNYFGFPDPIKEVFFREIARLANMEKPQPAVYTELAVNNLLVGAVDSEDDYTCVANLNWDAEFVHIILNITDDVLFFDPAADAWNVDNIEVYFDMDNSKNPTWPRNAGWPASSYDANDYQLRILPEKAWEDYNSLTGVALTTTLTGTGYDITIDIPWESLMAGFVPAAGVQIGFDVLASDNDGDGRNQITWNAKTEMPWNDASLFGTLEFTEGGGFKIIRDSEAPAVPDVTTATDGSTVTLNWSSTDNIAVLYYEVKRNGVTIQEKIYAEEAGNTLTVTDLEDGRYTFTIIAYDNSGNKATANVQVTVTTVAVNELPAGFKVFPNPSSGVVKISSGSANLTELEIYNLTGNRILSKTFVDNCILDLSGEHKGIYMLYLKTEDKTVVSKFVIK
ncbi:MAG: T9SS type A sorting domain-containing protein, partial [Prolixibacteraceae bacterium]|nr:T9SS type A sorting domain-containing protein [Prolixibacteraceae bacterium]